MSTSILGINLLVYRKQSIQMTSELYFYEPPQAPILYKVNDEMNITIYTTNTTHAFSNNGLMLPFRVSTQFMVILNVVNVGDLKISLNKHEKLALFKE